MNHTEVWSVRDTHLLILPNTRYIGDNQPLRWGMLLPYLAGLQTWLQAYPDLNVFDFMLVEEIEAEAGVLELEAGEGRFLVF